eukprot:2626_1
MNGTKDINNLGVFSRDFSKKYAKELDELRAKQQRLFIDFSKDLLQIDTDDAALVEEAIKEYAKRRAVLNINPVAAIQLNPYLLIDPELMNMHHLDAHPSLHSASDLDKSNNTNSISLPIASYHSTAPSQPILNTYPDPTQFEIESEANSVELYEDFITNINLEEDHLPVHTENDSEAKDRIWVCCDCCSYEWAFDEAITECEVCGHSNTSNLADPIQIEPNLLQLLDDCISRQDVVPVTVFSDEEEPDSLESLYEMLDIWIDAVQCRH